MTDNLKELGMFHSVAGEYEAYHARRAEASKCPITGMGAEFKPSDADYLQNPYVFFDKARPTEPVFYSPKKIIGS
ncbi:MAG: hypothetical protein ACPGWR_05120 [Ardenticatenaceae bacterium]